jgi:hypothetical protein
MTLEKTKFEYLVDRTIRIQNTTSCMVKSGSRITFKNCKDSADRWIFDVITNHRGKIHTVHRRGANAFDHRIYD